MIDITGRLNSFIVELRRRNVFRAAMLYLVGSWTALQVAATLFPLFEWPLWSIRAVLYGVLGCFPPIIVAAWSFEWTPDGLHRIEGRIAPTDGRTSAPRQRNIIRAFVYVAIGIAISSAGFGGYLYATRYIRGAEAALKDEPGVVIPDRAIILYSRAQAYEDHGRSTQAAELYRRIVQEFPEMEEARRRLAELEADSTGL